MTEKPAPDIISIGDVNVDLLMNVPRHPDLDPHGDRGSGVRGSEYRLGSGGVAGNVAAGLAQLGNRVGLIGVVGEDHFGGFLRRSLAARGIDLRCLRVIPGQNTSLVCCFESSQGTTVFYSCPGSTGITEDCLEEEYLSAARLVFLPGNILTQDRMTARVLVESLQKAKRRGTVIALDPSKFWLSPSLASSVHDAVGVSDLLLPNLNEAQLLTGCTSPRDASRALLAEGARVVAVKLGEQGCAVYSTDEEIEIPAFETAAQSVFGAGDAFNCGFLHGYLRGWTLQETARFALATASLKLRDPGAQAGLPTEAEVGTFLARQEE